ncbi:MAG: radical SAM protein [Candidatus Faecivicinus sp.]
MKYVCADCPRMCSAIRDLHSGNGFCRMGTEPVVARAALHFDEEPVISGTRGSGAVFFTGCSLRCCYCQNYPISHENFGKPLSVTRLRQVYAELILQGAHNINLVNPTHFAEPILHSLEYPLSVPVVWNSSGYERVETLKRFEGSVQVYLPDLKYIRAETAKKYSGAANYFEFAAPALKEMLRQAGPVRLDRNGLIQSGMIVRHLVLPGCADESIEILDWIADNLPGAWVSLMAQYVPCGKVEGVDELNRRITQEEYDRVSNHLIEIGLDDGFVQELSASDKKYIPPFDLSGVW